MNGKVRNLHLRLFTIVSLVLVGVLSMLPQLSLASSNHEVTFLSVTDLGDGTYKWLYEVTSDASELAISHLEWYLCVPCDAIVGVDANGDGNFTGPEDEDWECLPMGGGIYQLKMDDGWADGETRTVGFILNQNFYQGPVEVVVKYATLFDSKIVNGPVCEVPEYVELASVSVKAVNGGIEINWETALEVNNLGFNIYRSQVNDIGAAVQVNDGLIASQAFGNMAGASYTFLDSSAQGGVIYYYWLQDVEASGGTSALYNGIHALGAARRPVPARLPGRTIDF